MQNLESVSKFGISSMRLGCQSTLRSHLDLNLTLFLQDKTSWNSPCTSCWNNSSASKLQLADNVTLLMWVVNTVTEVQVEGTTCSSSVLCAVNTSTEVPAEGRIQCSSIMIHETSKKVQDVLALPLQPMKTMTVAHQSAVIYTGNTAPKKPTKDDPVNSRQALYQICTKYKWIHDFNLKSEEGMPHARRYESTATTSLAFCH